LEAIGCIHVFRRGKAGKGAGAWQCNDNFPVKNQQTADERGFASQIAIDMSCSLCGKI